MNRSLDILIEFPNRKLHIWDSKNNYTILIDFNLIQPEKSTIISIVFTPSKSVENTEFQNIERKASEVENFRLKCSLFEKVIF